MTISAARFTELHTEACAIVEWLQNRPWIDGATFSFSIQQNEEHLAKRSRLAEIRKEIGVTTDTILGVYGSAYWSGTAWIEDCPECEGQYPGCSMPGCTNGEISVSADHLRFRLRREGSRWRVIDSSTNAIVESSIDRSAAITALYRLRREQSCR
jgi:hypothetical protein